ncbi:MAG: type 1 glutamine amidotransferase [Chloroflexi bacterium]|nr:type 1 glutamine amidotransferase [Chloroflexota bacterium]
MKFLVLQHIPHETPGLFADLAREHGISLEYVNLWEGAAIPPLSRYEALLIMGGPMGVYDEGEHPWLREELAVLGRAAWGGMPILGICLGAQLLARALGARVSRNAEGEFGFQEVALTEEGRREPLFRGFGAGVPVFQWHHDTFALPTGASLLATSPLCPHQAFRFGSKAYGLQFHVETTPEMVARWVEEGAGELKEEGISGQALVHEAFQTQNLLQEAAQRLFLNFLSLASKEPENSDRPR